MNVADEHTTLEKSIRDQPGSERGFGLVFGIVFLVIGFFPVWKQSSPHYWALIAAGVFVAFSIFLPRVLRPLNWVWFRFGQLLHPVTSYIVLLVMFYGAVTPIGLLLRLLKKDVVNLKWDSHLETYWIVRQTPGPTGKSMKYPF